METCDIRCQAFVGIAANLNPMLRLLFVVDPALAEESVARALPRALRDEGHEVVYAAGLGEPDQVVATAVQEDVDGVLLLDAVGGAQVAERVVVLLEEGGAGDIAVVPLGPESRGAEVAERVRRQVGAAES